MPRKRKSPGVDPLCFTDRNQREVNANLRSSPPGWHPGEAAPGEFHLYPRDNGQDSIKSVGAPRMRESKFSPIPYRFPRGPPGFDNSINESRSPSNPNHSSMVSRNPPGFDKSNSSHGFKTIYEESLEITSDRPFLPQRRGPPGGSNISSPSDQIPRGDNRGTRVELRGSLLSPPTRLAADAVVLASPFETTSPPALRPGILGERPSILGEYPSILGEPPGPPSGGAIIQKSATADNIFEPASEVCLKLWKDLGLAMQKRERALRERERNFSQNSFNKQSLEEEIKQAAAMKNEVMEERRRLEEEAHRIREEKDAMERTSADIALQLVELKQVQKKIEKEKAAILALKAELGAREGCSQEQECVEATVHIPLGAVTGERGKPTSNPSINCHQIVNCSSASGVIPSNGQIWEPDKAMDILPMVIDRYLDSMKAEPVTSERGAAHEHESRRNDISCEDDMDDVPLAIRLKKRRVEKTGEKSRSSEEIKHADLNAESSKRRAGPQKRGPQSVGGKSLSYDIHMKRNKVPIEVALQEDAPGLLEQLEERGLLEDMAVYQDMGMDDSLAMECPGSEFGILEGVIGKLWGPTAGIGKDLVPIKGQASGNMPRYCLACLLSLIEQTRSLRKRNWPVEWGWCRRLRAFLFVFEKHNRIVLERPEYGYATYFFELVQKLPVKWQVQRLITVMSVATTGRAALLENRQLEVGLHITNEEAAILEDYGWIPSSGLGSLLNFCERVVHDYNKGQEDLGNDWKQKIGKLLMDGYDHGSIVQSIPRKLQRVLGENLSDTGSFSGLYRKAEPA